MRRRAQADDRFAGVDVVDDMLHLIVRQFAEASGDDHQIGFVQRRQAWNIARVVRIDQVRFGVDRK